MIDQDVPAKNVWKQGRDVKLLRLSHTNKEYRDTNYFIVSLSGLPMTRPVITPTHHNFQPYIFFFVCKVM